MASRNKTNTQSSTNNKKAAGRPASGGGASKKTAAAKPGTGRGSPEAITKRRVARQLNQLFSGGASSEGTKLDGRTAKRRTRLLESLKGEGKKTLKPIEILQSVHELLEMGESLGSLRKIAKVKSSGTASANAAELLKEIHSAYSFRPEAYSFLGLPRETLIDADLLDADAPRRGRPKKNP